MSVSRLTLLLESVHDFQRESVCVENLPLVPITVRLPVSFVEDLDHAASMMCMSRAAAAREFVLLGLEMFQTALGPDRWSRLIADAESRRVAGDAATDAAIASSPFFVRGHAGASHD